MTFCNMLNFTARSCLPSSFGVFHSSVRDYSVHLRYSVGSVGGPMPAFRENAASSSSRVEDILTLDDEDSVLP